MTIRSKIKQILSGAPAAPVAQVTADEVYRRTAHPAAVRDVEPAKIIFLDIDGVCTSARTGWFNFDIYAVNFILWICRQTGAKIVITSTWRGNHPQEFFQNIFGGHVLSRHWKTPHAVSPVDRNSGECRGREIDSWLQEHEEVTDYLILDDDTDFTPDQKNHFVRTSDVDGLLFDHMLQICTYFNITDYPDEIEEIYQHPAMFAANRPPRVTVEF